MGDVLDRVCGSSGKRQIERQEINAMLCICWRIREPVQVVYRRRVYFLELR